MSISISPNSNILGFFLKIIMIYNLLCTWISTQNFEMLVAYG